MATRIKWEILDIHNSSGVNVSKKDRHCRHALGDLISEKAISVFYQRFALSGNGGGYSHEGPFRITSPESYLFENISEISNLLSSSDIPCRRDLPNKAATICLKRNNSYQCINVCPETLRDPAHKMGVTNELAEKWKLAEEKIIFGKTWESPHVMGRKGGFR